MNGISEENIKIFEKYYIMNDKLFKYMYSYLDNELGEDKEDELFYRKAFINYFTQLNDCDLRYVAKAVSLFIKATEEDIHDDVLNRDIFEQFKMFNIYKIQRKE